MRRLHARLPRDERYPLTPREIVYFRGRRRLPTSGEGRHHRGAFRLTEPPASPCWPPLSQARQRAGAAVGDHLACQLHGWIPALNLLEPATEHPARRNALMIAVHLVWGRRRRPLCASSPPPRHHLRGRPRSDVPKGRFGRPQGFAGQSAQCVSREQDREDDAGQPCADQIDAAPTRRRRGQDEADKAMMSRIVRVRASSWPRGNSNRRAGSPRRIAGGKLSSPDWSTFSHSLAGRASPRARRAAPPVWPTGPGAVLPRLCAAAAARRPRRSNIGG